MDHVFYTCSIGPNLKFGISEMSEMQKTLKKLGSEYNLIHVLETIYNEEIFDIMNKEFKGSVVKLSEEFTLERYHEKLNMYKNSFKAEDRIGVYRDRIYMLKYENKELKQEIMSLIDKFKTLFALLEK